MTTTELYTWQFCPFAQRARIALALKGVEHEQHEIDITRPYPERFIELSANGKVPTLVVDGRPLFESEVICEFVDEAYPGPRLLPEDPYRRGVARLLIDYGKDQFIPPLYTLLLNQDEAKDGGLTDRALASWRWLNDRLITLADGDRFVFDEPCLADYAFGPFFQRWQIVEHYRFFALPEEPAFERIRAWRDACLDLEAVRSTAADLETLIKVYADYARGYDNARIPKGQKVSAFDVEAWPPGQREVPPRGLRARAGSRATPWSEAP